MKAIVAFGASNSSTSINSKLALYTSKQLDGFNVKFLDLNDYEMPLYSIDREKQNGFPQAAQEFAKIINAADGIIISYAEHNGAYSVAYKNIYDWVSRIDQGVWMDKPLLLMATSPGQRGGQSVLQMAQSRFSRFSKGKILSFSLPSFANNFSDETGIINQEFKEQHKTLVQQFIFELS